MIRLGLSPLAMKKLIQSENYREFLAHLIGPSGTHRDRHNLQKVSYAELSRRAGFSSRAFIRDVIKGTKNLSPSAQAKVCSALKLEKPLQDFFYLLVKLDQAQDLSTTNQLSLKKSLDHIRKNIQSKRNLKNIPASSSDARILLRTPDFGVVYAALGSLETGATFDTIKSRCGLNTQSLKMTLDKMVKFEFARLDTKLKRYFAEDFHLVLKHLGCDQSFAEDFERAVARAGQRFKAQAESKDRLFFVSNFCVQRSDLPELREKLRDLLQQFIGDAESSDGDLVVEMTVALTH